MQTELEEYEQSNWTYCCICGERIQKTFKASTNWRGIWEQFVCESHSVKEADDYCAVKIDGFCGICGKPFPKGDKPNCGHNAEY